MKIRAVKIDPVFYKKTGSIKELEYEDLEVDSKRLYDELKKITCFGAYTISFEVGRLWSLSREGRPFVFINGAISHPLYQEKSQDRLWIYITNKISGMDCFYDGIGRFSADSVSRPLLKIVK
jgi:hypothetical protein